MIRISAEAKLAIVKKALSRSGQSISEIASENNIGLSTLNKWVRRFKLDGHIEADQKNESDTSLTPAERFKHLQAISGLESDKVSAYCRKHGLYPHQLTQWETEFMTKTIKPTDLKIKVENKALRAENKALNRIIVRKDKVLAETVALLVLKKKAAQIWGESEEG